MLRVRDIMTTDLVTLTPETSVRDALDLLGRSHVSGAPVLSGEKLLGVVTTTDLMMFAGGLPGVPTQREVEQREAWDETPIEQEVEQEDEPSSAYFTELWDDAGTDADERMSSLSGPEWNALEEHDVTEVMTVPPLVTMPPDAEVETAAAMMKDHGIHRVLVVEGDTLVGLVTAFDVTKAVAEGKLTRRVFAFNRDYDFSEWE